MTSFKTISIIGCGWLGFPLAKELIAQGFQIKGSTTREGKLPMLRGAGIEAYKFSLSPDPDIRYNPALFESDLCVLNIPPGRKDPNVELTFPQKMESFIRLTKQSGTGKILFVSSTSVYGSQNGEVRENTTPHPETPSGRALLEAESLLSGSGLDHVILRPGGLTGPDRQPGRFLSGKAGVKGQLWPVNMLHLADAVGIIPFIMRMPFDGRIYNAVAPIHPTKKDFYTAACIGLNAPLPNFDLTDTSSGKLVIPENLLRSGYRFLQPDPMHFPEISGATGQVSE